MKKHEAEKLIETIRGFVDAPTSLDVVGVAGGKASVETRKGLPPPTMALLPGGPTAAPGSGNGHGCRLTDDQEEALYQRFRARFIDEATIDPTLVHLMMARPEIIVGYERRVEQLDGSTLRGRVCRLIAQGWLTHGRATGAIRKELARTGADPGGGGNLASTLADLVRQGFLERGEHGWTTAVGVKVTEQEIQTRGADAP